MLAKHTLVRIDGLQSDAGKKLNGGLGVIISSKTPQPDAKGVVRYPVRIFALKSADDTAAEPFDILSTFDDKKLKEENLSACTEADEGHDTVMEYFKSMIKEYINKAQQHRDETTTLYWCDVIYHVCPQAFQYTFSYANSFAAKGQFREAATIANKVLESCEEHNCDITELLARTYACHLPR